MSTLFYYVRTFWLYISGQGTTDKTDKIVNYENLKNVAIFRLLLLFSFSALWEFMQKDKMSNKL